MTRGVPPDVIAIFGMHLHPGSPLYITPRGEWETPLGNLAIAEQLAGELVQRFDFKVEAPERAVQENTIELQLPFIRHFFDGVRILPIGAPPTQQSLAVAKAAVAIADRMGLNLMVIGSTDLTHYGVNYGFVPEGTGPSAVDWVRNENDSRVIEAMTAMAPERVIAGGPGPSQCLLFRCGCRRHRSSRGPGRHPGSADRLRQQSRNTSGRQFRRVRGHRVRSAQDLNPGRARVHGRTRHP